MKYLLIGCLCLAAQISIAQPWVKMNTLPSIAFISLEKDNNLLYAATFGGNAVYISPDNGINWTPSVLGPGNIQINSFAIFDHILYAGTNNSGIFISSDTGRTWVNNGIGLLSVVSFAQWRNNIYAATLGTGVYTLDPITHNWRPFNTDLPSYSVNVFKVLNVNDTLIAAAGANGTLYRYKPLPGRWDENYYFSTLRPGLLINDMVNIDGSLLAATGGTRLIYSDNSGSSWRFDTAGLRRGLGFEAIINKGSNNLYAAINNALQGGSWLQKQDKTPGINSTWTDEGDSFPNGFTYAVRELDSKLFLCRSDGLYYLDRITAVGDPVTDGEALSIYPNPSRGQVVHIKSNRIISEITIVNLAGISVYQARVQQKEFNLPLLPNGLYIARVKQDKEVKSYKILVE